jgi:hypothetical protein
VGEMGNFPLHGAKVGTEPQYIMEYFKQLWYFMKYHVPNIILYFLSMELRDAP